MSQRRISPDAIGTDELFAGCHVPPSVAWGKRLADISLALAGLLLTAPLWPLIWLASGAGPLFRREARVGRILADRTELFALLRFQAPALAPLRDLPHLLNLLRGDISLIGPRAESPAAHARLDLLAPGFADRLIGLRPGLIGVSAEPDIFRRIGAEAAYAQDLATPRRWLRRDGATIARLFAQAARSAASRSA